MKYTELKESAGGMAKRWLESQTTPHYWTDANDNRYKMANLVQLPLESTELPMQDLLLELETVVENMRLKMDDVKVVNKQPNAPSAAMLIVMQDEAGKLYPFLKWFRKRTMDVLGMHWTPADFYRETGLEWEQTRVTGTGKNKTAEVIKRIDLKPVDTVAVNTDVRAVEVPVQVEQKLKDKGIDDELVLKFVELTNNALLGKKNPVEGLAPYERDIKVDFGEVTTPLALIDGTLAGGDYQSVNTELLKPLGVTWKSARSAFYPEALNEPLYDSQLTWANGTVLRISNKAEGKGGAASLASIATVIKRYPERFSAEDKNLLATKYDKFVKAVNIITTNTSVEGPLKLAVALNKLSEDDANIVRRYLAEKITKDTSGLSQNLKNILNDTTIMNAKKDKPDYAVCYHLISAIARIVVKYLNEDVALSSEFFRFILTRANLVQVNQFTSRTGDAVGWQKFDVVWPPVFTGKIMFSASDFQSNKRPGNRLAFKT